MPNQQIRTASALSLSSKRMYKQTGGKLGTHSHRREKKPNKTCIGDHSRNAQLSSLLTGVPRRRNESDETPRLDGYRV